MPQTTDQNDDQLVLEGKKLQSRLAEADSAERAKILTETIRQHASTVLEQTSFTPETNFIESGLTSVRALEFSQILTTLTGIEIPLVALIEHSTPEDLGQFMADLPTTD